MIGNHNPQNGPAGHHDDFETIARKAVPADDIAALSPEKIRQMLNELETHQAQLAVQNDKLKQALQELEASRDRYFNFYNLAPVGYVILDDQGLILELNPAAAELLGVRKDAVAGLPLTRFIFPGDLELYGQHCRQPLQTGGSQSFELKMVDNEGAVFWALLSTTVTQDANGVCLGHIGIRDVTRRKETEAALSASERSYRELFERSPVGIFKTNSTGQALFANPEMAKIVGAKSTKEVIETYQDLSQNFFVDPRRRQEFVDLIKEKGAVENFEYEGKRLDGKHIWLNENARVSEKFPDGTFIIDGFSTDITERKRAEEALRESENKYRLIAENTADMIVILDMNLCLVYVSPAVTRLRGFTVEEAMGQTLDQVLTPESFQLVVSVFETEMQLEASGTAAPGRTRILELEEYKKDGSAVWMEVSLSFLRDKDQNPYQIISVSRDISERKQSEAALRESEQRFRTLFEQAGVGVAEVQHASGQFLQINQKYRDILGYDEDEATGLTYQQVTHPDDLDKSLSHMKALIDGKIKNFTVDKRYIRKSGEVVWVNLTVSPTWEPGQTPTSNIAVVQDITERIHAEKEKEALREKLQQAQKFEAIGTLAGGVAHDFNNLLMGIQGHASLMSLDQDRSHPHREHIHAIEEYIRSATDLTRQLLGFARGGKYETKPLDINELVQGSAAMFGRTKKEIQIHTKFQASPLVVEADRGQIEQVLLNMYINAWQAMPPEGGELYLETKSVTLDEAYCKPHQAVPARFVKVSITDTGKGMDEATRHRIFDPFFTTKEMARGTGLGLASAYGIIKNHGGMVTVYSEIDHGTTFNIYLPVSGSEAYKEAAAEKDLVRGSATILFVDDEALVIQVGQAMLDKLGYRVVACRTGQEAVNAVRAMGNEIDLVILDMIMPEMDGGRIFDRIREIQPDMPVLLSSGYAINGHAEKIMRRGCNGFIQKPYNIRDLSNKVRQILDAGKGQPGGFL